MPKVLRDEMGRPLPPSFTQPTPAPRSDLAKEFEAAAEQLERDMIEHRKKREPRWRNAFGEPVDLDNIDNEYALNILMMYHARCVKMGYTREDVIEDRLIQKLREVVLRGRSPGFRDKLRAEIYNYRTSRAGLPFRGRGFSR